MSFLPSRDRDYLVTRSIPYEELESGNEKAIKLKGWKLPPGKFDISDVDVLLLLPGGYPDARPDMFYVNPWVKLLTTGKFPRCADQSLSFGGINWQRWSRHSAEWRSGKDGIWTLIKRIEHAVGVAE